MVVVYKRNIDCFHIERKTSASAVRASVIPHSQSVVLEAPRKRGRSVEGARDGGAVNQDHHVSRAHDRLLL